MRHDGLLNAVNVVASQLLQPFQSHIGRETAIGINTEFHFLTAEMLAYVLNQVEFFRKVDSTDF